QRQPRPCSHYGRTNGRSSASSSRPPRSRRRYAKGSRTRRPASLGRCKRRSTRSWLAATTTPTRPCSLRSDRATLGRVSREGKREIIQGMYGIDIGPTLGVREPRKPKPQTNSGGAALQPPRNDYAEAQALAESPRVVVSEAADCH